MSAIALDGKIQMLPLQKQQEVSDYVDFLLSSVMSAKVSNASSARPHPYAGCMRGAFGKMSDDFNATPDDFKDYM